mgnify:CR=1 FL=1
MSAKGGAATWPQVPFTPQPCQALAQRSGDRLGLALPGLFSQVRGQPLGLWITNIQRHFITSPLIATLYHSRSALGTSCLPQLPVARQVERGPDVGLAHLLEQFSVQAQLGFVARGFLGEKAFDVLKTRAMTTGRAVPARYAPAAGASSASMHFIAPDDDSGSWLPGVLAEAGLGTRSRRKVRIRPDMKR